MSSDLLALEQQLDANIRAQHDLEKQIGAAVLQLTMLDEKLNARLADRGTTWQEIMSLFVGVRECYCELFDLKTKLLRAAQELAPIAMELGSALGEETSGAE